MNTAVAMRMVREFDMRGMTSLDLPARSEEAFQRLVLLRREVYGEFPLLGDAPGSKGPLYRRIFFWPAFQVEAITIMFSDDLCDTAYSVLEYKKFEIREMTRDEIGGGLVRITFRKS